MYIINRYQKQKLIRTVRGALVYIETDLKFYSPKNCFLIEYNLHFITLKSKCEKFALIYVSTVTKQPS